jgi:winged helix DNA-binding protein
VPRNLLTLRQLNRATLARQLLLERHDLTPVAATAHLVALQAQVPRPPFIGLWSRTVRATREGIVKDLLAKRLVRGTFLRGTLHVMSADDYRRFRTPLQLALDRGIRVIGERADTFDVEQVLALGRTFFKKAQTFDAFRDHLAATYPDGDVRAMAYATRMQVPLLQVPTDTPWGFPAQAGFMSADAWLGSTALVGSSVDDLMMRYLAAYGPATCADAQSWCGIPGLKAVFERLRPRLVSFKAERGGEVFDLPDAPRPDEDVPAPVRFLPDWDNAIVGRADARMLDPQHRARVFQPGLRVLATVLVDGMVAATWKIERTKSAADLTVTTFGTVPSRRRPEIEKEGKALLAFVEPDAATARVKIA